MPGDVVHSPDRKRGVQPRARASDKEGVVLITGASGFLGRAIAGTLDARFEIVGLDFEISPVPHPDIEAIRVDLSSDSSVAAALGRVRRQYGDEIVSVIHLAAYYDLSGDPDPKYDAITVEGTERLMRELRDFKVEQFVLASTMLVHAPANPGTKLDEDAPLKPQSPYPQSKVEAEKALLRLHGDTPIVFLRLAGVYDEMCRAAFLAEQIAAIFEKRLTSRVFPGELDRGQPYLHLEDLCEAIGKVIDRRRDLPAEAVLLIGEPDTPTYAELQNAIGVELHGEAWRTREIPKPVAVAGQWVQEQALDQDPFVQPWMIEQAGDHYELDISRAERLIDWRPHHRLLAALPQMLARLKADPGAWYEANKLNAARVADIHGAAQIERAPAPDPAVAEAVRARAHRETLWAPLANIALGAWLLSSPAALGLFDAATAAGAAAPPAAGHALPDAAARNAHVGWSDVVSGALLVSFASLSLKRRFGWARWAVALVGLWLLFAPLVFWAPSAAAFANDTIVGALAIAFALIAGVAPGVGAEALSDDTDTPAGWTYSPSTWAQRLPIVALALAGFLLSRYLTAFQLGHIPAAWDPAFGDGTETVITSWASKAWPIPDAGLGAATYLLEVLSGALGDRRRWRTMPWLVLAFGLLIVPLGAVSIAFIIIQPTLIGTWCGLCLVTAVITVVMIPYSLDELVATGQFLYQSKRGGRSLWRTFWLGGSLPGGGRDKGPDLTAPFSRTMRAFLTGGTTFPPSLVACALIGVALLATRPLFGTEGAMADSDHVVGCLVVTLAVAALAEVGRAARLLIVPLGAWIVVSPFLLGGESVVGAIAAVLMGGALVVLSLPRGRLSGDHYGGWDRWIV